FKVGDKVVLEGVVSEIEASWSYPLKVTMKGGLYDYLRPDHLQHADAAPDAEPVCWANIYSDDSIAIHHSEMSAREFGPRHLATEIAVPLYRVPPDASKRIEELEDEVEYLRGKVASHEAEITLWTKECERMR